MAARKGRSRRPQRDNYQEIANRFIAALEAGTVPWQQPWASLRPRSLSTGEPYHGTNRLILSLVAAEHGYSSAWWGTYDQIARLSGLVRNPETGRWESPDGTNRGVRAGEHGEYITRWITWKRTDEGEDGEDEIHTGRTLKIFKVFNAEQAEQLPAQYYQAATEFAEITDAEVLLKGYLSREGAPAVIYGGDLAYYTTDGTDEIHSPARELFDTPEAFYTTNFHEATHSTGWRTRLGRAGVEGFDHFGSAQYAEEELVAEIGAALLAAEAGIDGQFDQSAAYVANWLGRLKNDNRMIIHAAAAAQRAVDYITGEDADEPSTT